VPAHAAPAAAEAPALPAEAAPPLPQDTPSASAGSAGGWQQIEDAGAGPSSSVGAGPSSSAGPSGSAANGDASSHKPPESVEAIEAKATGEEAALLKVGWHTAAGCNAASMALPCTQVARCMSRPHLNDVPSAN
jgi:hypothetical protein